MPIKNGARRYGVLVILLLVCTVPLCGKPPYKLSIACIFRDDARFLKEWVAYHRLVGVEHFWLFNNLSVDEYQEVLAPYVAEGIVELIDWPFESTDWQHWHYIQRSAYEEALKLAVKKKRIGWLLYRT